MIEYLNKIKFNKPLNFKVFLKKFEKTFPDKIFWNIFDVKELSSKEALIYIKNDEYFNELVKRVEEGKTTEGSDRLKATIQGDSHKATVSTYYILVFHKHTGLKKPDVVVVNRDSVLYDFIPKKNLLVIENQENFSQIEKHLSFMNHFDDHKTYSVEDYDIIFSSGGYLTNKAISNYLNMYENIVFSLDIDNGGINIYTLMTRCVSKEVSCSFWIPSNVDYLISYYGNFLSQEELRVFYEGDNARDVELALVRKKISDTHKKLEQEIFLHPKFIEDKK